MKKLFFTILLCLYQSVFALQDEVLEKIQPIQKEWAIVKYRMLDANKAKAYQKLAQQAGEIAIRFPDRAEPLIWQAINLSSFAGAIGGLQSITKALPAVKKARDLLHQAEQIDAAALNGSVYTSLGALYYQVPGWPIGFGDKKHARYYLEKAMATNTNKLDAGYFYGDYLMNIKDYEQAQAVLENALQEPALDGRPVADAGRRDEIMTLINQIKAKVKS